MQKNKQGGKGKEGTLSLLPPPGRITRRSSQFKILPSLSFPKKRSGEERDFIFSLISPAPRCHAKCARAKENMQSGISKVNSYHVPIMYSYYVIKLYYYHQFLFSLIPCNSQFSTLYIHFETARLTDISKPIKSKSAIFSFHPNRSKCGPSAVGRAAIITPLFLLNLMLLQFGRLVPAVRS